MGSEITDFAPMVYILVIGASIYWIVRSILAKDEDAKALSWASGNAPTKSSSPAIEISRSLVHQLTIQHVRHIKSPAYRKKVEHLILTSGLSAELNVEEFIGMQILWGFVVPIFFVVLNFALQLGYPYWAFLLIVPIGWQFPKFHANAKRNERSVAVRSDLPFFIDLMALATEAGMDFQGAIQRIVEKIRGKNVLAEEFNIVLRDLTLGSSRAQAMKAMSARLDISELTSFVNVVVDADSTGASVAQVLKDQAIQMRLERFLRAEKEGAKASQKILIPLMIFILPAVFIMALAPMALQFIYGSGQ